MKWFKSLSEPLKVAYIAGVFSIIVSIIGGIFLLESKTATDHSSPTPTAIISVTAPTITTSPSSSLLPPALVQQNISLPGSTTSNVVKFPNPVKAGDLIVVAITQDETTVTGTPTDNLRNIYTPVRTGRVLFANPTNHHDYVELYYAKNVIGGDTTVTVTFTTPFDANSGDSNVGIYEFSGLDKTTPLGPVASQSRYGNMPDAGTLTTTLDNELIFVVGVDSGLDNQNDPNINTPASLGKGYLSFDKQQDDSVSYERFYTEYQIATPGTHNTDFSLKFSSYWAVIGATFKPAQTTPLPTDTPTPIPSPPSTPQKTLQTLCNAATNEDYQTKSPIPMAKSILALTSLTRLPTLEVPIAS